MEFLIVNPINIRWHLKSNKRLKNGKKKLVSKVQKLQVIIFYNFTSLVSSGVSTNENI